MRDRTLRATMVTRAAALVLYALVAACASGGGGDTTPPVASVPDVVVAVEPADATVTAGTTQPFVATVLGSVNTAVTWTVQEADGGSISDTGIYTAPSAASIYIYHVVATSQADPTKRATATVTVVPAPVVSVSIRPPKQVSLSPGGSYTFSADVTNSANKAVTWSLEPPGLGRITPNGTYTAPQSSGRDRVIATSQADPTKTDFVDVTITSPPAPPVTISPVTATVAVGGRAPFALSSPDPTTRWAVAGAGTISPLGVYTAPFLIPTPNTVTISASGATNTASVTIASRFLAPEAVRVDACSPSCPVDIPNAIVAADLNRDGWSDVMTANAGSGTASVLLSADASHFSLPVRYAVGNPNTSDPEAVSAADVNADTYPDLVVADADPNGLAVRTRLGRGDGTFPAEVSATLPAGSNPLSMASGHFDADGFLDLVVANYITSTLTVLRGDGTGVFPRLTTILAGVASPLSVTSTDFDQNSMDDLAVANSGDNTVAVFLSNGDGTFQAARTYPVLGGPSAVVAVDLNADGCSDLAVTSAVNSTVTVLLNQKAGTCQSVFAPASPYPTEVEPIALASGDWNKDGAQDLVVVNRNGKSITIFLGHGDGTLINSETYPVGALPQAVAVGDFNGDSWPDLAVANSGDDTVTILRNRGS